jgi:hypothetical protein
MADMHYGRRNTGADPAWGEIGANNQRAYIPNTLTETIIAYAMGTRAGRSGASTPLSRMGIGSVSGSAPGALLAYTGSFSPSNASSYGGDLTTYTADLETPLLMTDGSRYALVLTAKNASLGHGMIPSDNISATDENMYTRSGLSTSIPLDPIAGSGSPEGHMTLWVTGEINVAPNTPTNVSPSGGLSAADLTPNIEADFSDANETLPNGKSFDYLNRVHIRVERDSDDFEMWDYAYTASSAERTAKRSSKAYAGTALVIGTTYRIFIRHSDRAGAYSGFAQATFTINAGGTVVMTSSTPVGKILTTTPTFTAQWTHQTSSAADRTRIRLLQGGEVITESQEITISVAANGTISIPWASIVWSPSLPGNALLPGSAYRYQIKARATTGGVWSPYGDNPNDAGDGIRIDVNSTPNVPTNLAPSQSQVVTSLPKLTFAGTDADDPFTSLTGSLMITRADLSTVTRTATRNLTTGLFEYQTTSTDLPAVQTFTWKAQVSDGTFTSAYSANATVVYATGLTVTLTAPTPSQVITTASLPVSWSAIANQTHYEVQLWELNSSGQRLSTITPSYTTGTVVSAATSFNVPATAYKNLTNYEVVVKLTNNLAQTGNSAATLISINFTPPDTLNLTATPVRYAGEVSFSSIYVEWSPTTYSGSAFLGYYLWRTPLSGENAGQRELLRKIPRAAQVGFVDAHPVSGVDYLYELSQLVRIGTLDVYSIAAQAQTRIDLESVVLTLATNPETYRIELHHRSARGSGPFMVSEHVGQRQRVYPINARLPRVIVGTLDAWKDVGTFALLTTDDATAEQKINDWRELMRSGGTICLRDFTGVKRFVTLDANPREDRYSIDRYEVTMSFMESHFHEGEFL